MWIPKHGLLACYRVFRVWNSGTSFDRSLVNWMGEHYTSSHTCAKMAISPAISGQIFINFFIPSGSFTTYHHCFIFIHSVQCQFQLRKIYIKILRKYFSMLAWLVGIFSWLAIPGIVWRGNSLMAWEWDHQGLAGILASLWMGDQDEVPIWKDFPGDLKQS